MDGFSRGISSRNLARRGGGGSRTGLDPGGGFRGSAGRTSSRLRISSGSSSSSPSPRDRSSPSPPPPPPDPASSPPSGGHHRPPRTSRARPPRPPRGGDGPARGSLARRGRPVSFDGRARRGRRAETRAREVRHARSPDPRRVVVASCRTRSSRGARAIARHDRGARNASRRTRANGGHQRASRRECRGRHRRRRRDSPLRARWGVVGPGR